MWCPSCKADVAAEVAVDNRRVYCATCGVEISASAAFPGLTKTREARDLLERWANERKETAVPASSHSRSGRHSRGERTSADSIHGEGGGGVRLERERRPESTVSATRIDSAQPLPAPAAIDRPQMQAAGSANSDEHSLKPDMASHSQYGRVRHEATHVHRQHARSAESPHFQVQENLIDFERKRTNWTAIVGQLLAYAGVALLTVGSTLVLWSYFGGPANFGPTGWLTTTAGQMLLFLGVVTLVSGGMEQTSQEVKTRIERLGERIIRIEQIARDQSQHRPNLPADSYEQAHVA